MARFVFRVQAALDLRQRQEEEARAALARAEARQRDAQARRDRAREELYEALNRGSSAEHVAGAVTERQWYRNWILLKRRDIERQQRELDACAAEVRQATARAQEAHRQRRILERLRERAASRFDANQRRAEQKSLDELGTLRHRRIQRGGHT